MKASNAHIAATPEALHLAHAWGLQVTAALRAGTEVPNPHFPRGFDIEGDGIRGIAGMFQAGEGHEDPKSIIAAAIRFLGQPILAEADDRIMKVRVTDLRNEYAIVPEPRLDALSLDQMDLLSRAASEHRVPTELLEDQSLSPSTRNAILEGLDDGIFESELLHQDRYGSDGANDAGDSTEGGA